MSVSIVAAIRHQTQLHGNTFLIATELAHRMNPQGYGRVSYQFLAWKAHCCRRTAIAQVGKLLALGLIRKTVIRTRGGYAWNLYQYVGARIQSAAPPATTHGATLARTLPDSGREKELSLAEEIRRLRQGMHLWTPGTVQYTACLEALHRLEGHR